MAYDPSIGQQWRRKYDASMRAQPDDGLPIIPAFSQQGSPTPQQLPQITPSTPPFNPNSTAPTLPAIMPSNIGPDQAVALAPDQSAALPQIAPTPPADAPTTAAPPADLPDIPPSTANPYGSDPASQQALPTIPATAGAAGSAPYDYNSPLNDMYRQYVQAGQYQKKESVWNRVGAFLQGWAKGGLVGGIDAAKDPHYWQDIHIASERAKILPQIQTLETARKSNAALQEQAAQTKRMEAEAGWYGQRPEIEQGRTDRMIQNNMRSNMARQYNSAAEFHDDAAHPDDQQFADAYEKAYGFRPPNKDAKTKSQQMIDQRNGQVYLVQTDTQGGNKVVKLMNDDGTPMTVESKEMLTSEDKAKQRDLQKLIADDRNVTTVKAAEIGAHSRENVANIGATSREKVATMNNNTSIVRSQHDSADRQAKVLAAIDAIPPLPGESPEQLQTRKNAARDKYIADQKALMGQQ